MPTQPHLDLLRLQAQITGRLHSLGPTGKPVGDDGGEGTDAHQRGGRKVAEELAEVIELGEPQAPQDFLSLHLLHERHGDFCKSRRRASSAIGNAMLPSLVAKRSFI